MAEAAAATAAFTKTAETGMGKSESALTKLVGSSGSSARELRMMALELGALGGAGTVAGRAMYGLIEATRAFEEGLTTLGGMIGIVTASIGIAVTAYSYLISAKRKAWQETATEIEMLDKLEKRQVSQQADTIARVGEMYKEQSATAEQISRMVRANKIREDQHTLRRSMTKENEADINSLLKLMDRDIASILRTGKSLSDLAKATNEYSKATRDETIDVNRLALAHEAAAKRSAKAWEDFGKSFSDTFADAAVNAEWSIKKIGAALVKEAERIAARKVIGGIVSALLAPLTGGASLGASTALNFMSVGAESQARSGSAGKQ